MEVTSWPTCARPRPQENNPKAEDYELVPLYTVNQNERIAGIALGSKAYELAYLHTDHDDFQRDLDLHGVRETRPWNTCSLSLPATTRPAIRCGRSRGLSFRCLSVPPVGRAACIP